MKVNDIIEKWNKEFVENNVANPKESAENIVAYALNIEDVTDVYKNEDNNVAPANIERITDLCRQRLRRRPIGYITGKAKFRNLIFKMSPPTFIPMIESEKFIDIILNEVDTGNVKNVLEIGCGSGVVSLTLLKERPHLRITAVDMAEHACELTKENAKLHNLTDKIKVIHAEITADSEVLQEIFDVIFTCPPYLPTAYIDDLPVEVAIHNGFEVYYGGNDGLDIVKNMITVTSKLLQSDGKIFCQIFSTAQNELLKSWLEENEKLALKLVRVFKDFRGDDRFVEIIKK